MEIYFIGSGKKLKSGKARSRKRHNRIDILTKRASIVFVHSNPYWIKRDIFSRHSVTRNRLCSTPPSSIFLSISKIEKSNRPRTLTFVSKLIQNSNVRKIINPWLFPPRKKKRKRKKDLSVWFPIPNSPILLHILEILLEEKRRACNFHVTYHSILVAIWFIVNRVDSCLGWIGDEEGEREKESHNTGLIRFPSRCINLPVAGNAYWWMN